MKPWQKVTIAAIGMAGVLVGCYVTRYELELRLDKEGLHRTWRVDSKIKEAGYVDGRFAQSEDHFGWYLRESSPLGSVSVYSEQVHGDEEQGRSLDKRRIAYDRLVDLWLAWLATEFEGEEGYSQFRDFVDGELRADGWDLFLFIWAFDIVGTALQTSFSDTEQFEEHLGSEITVRILNYLAIRGYINPEELMRIIAAAEQMEELQNEPMLEIFARGLATRMGVSTDDPLPGPLAAAINNPHRYGGSIQYFLNESHAIRRLAESWNAETVNDELKIDLGPDADSVVSQLGVQFAEFDIFGSVATHKATLHLPVEPLATNGRWNPAGKVEWSVHIGERIIGERLPILVYAVWAEPDAEFQEQHFGKVVIDNTALVDFLPWYIALDAADRDQWDEFVSSLIPGDGLVPTLQAFCFDSERIECEAKATIVAPYCETSGDQDSFRNARVPTRTSTAHWQVYKIVISLNDPCSQE